MDTELIPHSTISAMVDNWEAIKLKLQNATETIRSCDDSLKLVFGDHVSIGYKDMPDYERLMKDLRNRAWYAIIGKTEIKKFLSIKREKELEKNINEDLLGDLTTENILNLFRGASANIHNLMDETIVEVFNILRPHMSGYKRNESFAGELGNKVVMSRQVQKAYAGNGFRVSYYRDSQLKAINNAFFLLDGKGYQQSYNGELYDTIESCGNNTGETTYFKFKCYQNGNLHLEFKRMDLVSKMNAIVSKNVLRKAV